MQNTLSDGWLLISREDLIAARVLFKDGTALRPAFYLSQQCAEKSLKAFLVYHTNKAPHTHDLLLLTMRCITINTEFARFQKHAQRLNPYATLMRYPENLWYSPDTLPLDEALEFAGAILNFVTRTISP